MSDGEDVFISSHDSYEDAEIARDRYASKLKKDGIADQYGVFVRIIPGTRGKGKHGVYVHKYKSLKTWIDPNLLIRIRSEIRHGMRVFILLSQKHGSSARHYET